jgi:hypothetical protein
VPFTDSSLALLVQNERDQAVVNDPGIRTAVFAAGGVAAARASRNPALVAAANQYHQACRRTSALGAAQGVLKPPRRSKAQRQARKAKQVQQAQAVVAAAKAEAEAAATEKRLKEGSQLAHDPSRPKATPSRGFNSVVTDEGVSLVPRRSKGVKLGSRSEPVGTPSHLPALNTNPLKRSTAPKSILDRVTKKTT